MRAAATVGIGYGGVYDLDQIRHCFQLHLHFDVTWAS
jgi:hypothetical protein